MSRQLSLAIGLREDYSFDNFYTAEMNRLALQSLHACLDGSGDDYVYLWGQRGSGLTHILQACCQWATANQVSTFYLPLEELIAHSCDILLGLEQYQLICIDNIHQVKQSHAWQEALFHLYNKIRQSGGRLIVSSNCPPAQLDLALADLKSRLAAGMIFQLHGLTDEEKIEVLRRKFLYRGLKANDEVLNFILRRGQRNMAALMTMVEKLDQRSFDEKRKLTVPFIKEVMDW